jgi:hypothetical protein
VCAGAPANEFQYTELIFGLSTAVELAEENSDCAAQEDALRFAGD